MGPSPHFRFDQGHIVQVQPGDAFNGSHMCKVEAAKSIDLVI